MACTSAESPCAPVLLWAYVVALASYHPHTAAAPACVHGVLSACVSPVSCSSVISSDGTGSNTGAMQPAYEARYVLKREVQIKHKF
jgi:hypothetical protein